MEKEESLAGVPLLNREAGKKEQKKQSNVEKIMVVPSLASF